MLPPHTARTPEQSLQVGLSAYEWSKLPPADDRTLASVEEYAMFVSAQKKGIRVGACSPLRLRGRHLYRSLRHDTACVIWFGSLAAAGRGR